MLQYIQQRASSLGVKIILGLIVLSFVVGGMIGIFNNGLTSRYLVTVGREQVTLEEFQTALADVQGRIQQNTKTKIDRETLKKMGIYDRVIEKLTGEAALRQEISELGLITPDTAVRDTIHLNPTFHGEDGRFDPEMLKKFLAHQHLSENAYIQMVRKNLLKMQLVQPLVSGAPIPQGYVDRIFQAFFQKRRFATLHIPYEKIAIKGNDLNDAQLKGFYEKNRQLFLIPQVRSFTVLYTTADRIASQFNIKDEEIKEAYESRVSEFTIEEKRHILQISSPDKAALEEAAERIRKGEKVTTVTHSMNLELTDLGILGSSEASEAIASAAFGLEINQPSELVKTPLGWMIAVVKEIVPEKFLKLQDVSAQIKQNLLDEKINKYVESLQDKVEDALASGENLEAIAKEFNLKMHSVTDMMQNGYLKASLINDDKHPEVNLPADMEDDLKADLLSEVFQTENGKDTPLRLGSKGSLAVARVQNVQEAYVPQFEDMKDRVAKFYKKNKQIEVAAKIARELSEKIKSLSDMNHVANINGYEVKTHAPFNFTEAEKDKKIQKTFGTQGLQNLFFIKKGGTIFYPVADQLVVTLVEDILPFKKEEFSEQATQFEMSFQYTRAQEIESAYIQGLLKRFKIKENKSLIDALKNQ